MNACTTTTTARFSGQQSYQLLGDQILLEAELSLANPQSLQLQLWATPVQNPASAIKVAELNLPEVPASHGSHTRVSGTVPAWVPAGQQEYVLSLSLLDAAPAAVEYDRIHFPVSTQFLLPQLQGAVNCQVAADSIQVHVPGISNPRAEDNLSGSLALELWALPEPYQGGAFTGVQLARQELGQLAGQQQWRTLDFGAAIPAGLQGDWYLTVMLREWTAGGYLTRDFQTQSASQPLSSTPEVVAPTPVPAPSTPVAPTPSVSAQTSKAKKTASRTLQVSINKASEAELQTVKGISKSMAAAIVAGRPYQRLTDLLQVRGIGSKTLEKLLGNLAL